MQILHLSLREFLIDRACSSPSTEQFHIDEVAHNKRLPLSCLTILGDDIDRVTPSLGYLSSPQSYEMPVIAEGLISEELWYACSF